MIDRCSVPFLSSSHIQADNDEFTMNPGEESIFFRSLLVETAATKLARGSKSRLLARSEPVGRSVRAVEEGTIAGYGRLETILGAANPRCDEQSRTVQQLN